MDKSWMQLQDTLSPEYREGVKQFIDFAWGRASKMGMMLCPCVKCSNGLMRTREDVEGDLISNGMVKSYTTWRLHGEEVDYGDNESKEVCDDHHDWDDRTEMIVDDSRAPRNNLAGKGPAEHSEEDEKLHKLLEEGKQELYPGCENYSQIDFIEKLLHIKKVSGWSDESITQVLGLFKEALPGGETLPSSCSEAEKIIQDKGLDSVKKDASPNVVKRKKSGRRSSRR